MKHLMFEKLGSTDPYPDTPDIPRYPGSTDPYPNTPDLRIYGSYPDTSDQTIHHVMEDGKTPEISV